MSGSSPDGVHAASPTSGRGGGGGVQSASEHMAAPSSQPALLRLLWQLRSQQRRGSSSTVPNLHSGQLGIGGRGGRDGGGGGADTAHQGSSGHVAVQIGSDSEGQPRNSPSGDASRLRGHSITTSEAGHLADAIDEHRMAGAEAAPPRPRRHRHRSWLQGTAPAPRVDDEEAFERAVDAQVEEDRVLDIDASRKQSLLTPEEEDDVVDEEDATLSGNDADDGGGSDHGGNAGQGSKKPGRGKGAGGGGGGAGGGFISQEKLEDWTQEHISELYKASLAKEVTVSRELWERYTDPARQQRRQDRGLRPSIVIGTVTQRLTPFRGRRKHHPRLDLAVAHPWWRHLLERVPMMYPTALTPILVGLVVGIMDCTYSAFFIPVTTVFKISLTSWNWVTITDAVAAVIFTIDIITTLCTGLVIVYNLRQAVVMDRKIVAKHYLLHGTLSIDIIATGPLWVEVFTVATAGSSASQSALDVLNALRVARLCRLIRVFRAALKQSFMPTSVRWLPHGLGYFFNLTFTTALVINLLGCIWYYTARVGGIRPGNTWLADVSGHDLTDDTHVAQFIAAIYWATTTVTTIGYGDITPSGTGERVVAMVVMLIGVLFFGFLIGAVGEFLEHASASAQRGRLFRSKMEGVDRWMEARNLPRHMRAEITTYYSDIWTRHTAYHDSDFFEDLPAALRGKVARYRTRPCVANSELGQALGPRALLVLSTVILPSALQPGHDLCQQGASADRLWFLTEGSVLAIAHGRSMARVTAPAVLGESALLAAIAGVPAKRPLTYRASVSCALWDVAVDDILRMQSLQPGILDDLAAYFINQASKSLSTMEKRHMERLFPDAQAPEDVVKQLQAELRASDDQQSVAAEVIAALDVDVEALGGRRDIVMPTLDKVRKILDDKDNSSSAASLRTIGRNVITSLRLNKGRVSSFDGGAGAGTPSAASRSEGADGEDGAQTNGEAAPPDDDDPLKPGNLRPPTRFAALQHLDSRAPVDPEQMSLAEAAAWTWHAGADEDAARAARAAAKRRVAAVMASVPGASPGPRSASHSDASPAAHGAAAGGFFGLVSQACAASSGGELPPRSPASAPQLHRQLSTPAGSPAADPDGGSVSVPDGARPPRQPAGSNEVPAAAASAAGGDARPRGEAEAVQVARAAIAQCLADAESQPRTGSPSAGESEPQLQQHRAREPGRRQQLPWGLPAGGAGFGHTEAAAEATEAAGATAHGSGRSHNAAEHHQHRPRLPPPPPRLRELLGAGSRQRPQQPRPPQQPDRGAPQPQQQQQLQQQQQQQRPHSKAPAGGGEAAPAQLPDDRAEPPQLQEFLDGRALLTPQQRGRLQDFLTHAGPDELERIQESALLLEERRLEAHIRAGLEREDRAQAARDPLRHAWPEAAPP